MAWLLIFLGVCLCVAVAIIAVPRIQGLKRFLRSGSDRDAAAIERLREATGAARCLIALEILNQLAARPDALRAATLWAQLEMPLVQVLPDCPPALKRPLADALERCAGVITHRDTAKGMMTLRNALTH